MRFLPWGLIVLCACGAGAAPPTTGPVSPPSRFTVIVTNGWGGGSYAPGDTVIVFAGVSLPGTVTGSWTGDALAGSLTEWSGRFVMPARAVSLSVVTPSVAVPLTVATFAGATNRPKTYRYFVPPNPRGLVMAFHGTGGSSLIVERGEGRALASEAVAAGYAVLAFESEETAAGDLDGNGKERWDVSLTPTNTDLLNLDLLIAQLRSRGIISPTLPLYGFGMSNGASMVLSLGAIAAEPTLAARFPSLRFRALVGYCASGRAAALQLTRTPTAWYICRNDTNEEVGPAGNSEQERNVATLMARDVPTDLAYNEPAPIVDERFTRDASISLATSRALVAELRVAGALDARGFLVRTPEAIFTDVSTGVGTYPVARALTTAQRSSLIDAVRESYADHALFADCAKRMLAFFGRF